MTGSYSNAAGTRAYKLYIPSGGAGQRLPLIVMLHGCTQTPDDFAAGTRMNALAEERTCFIAYPAQPVSANPSKCWNWFTPGNQQRGAGEPSLIAGITRQIMRDYPVDPQRVYVAGLSAGAAAAAIMGMTSPISTPRLACTPVSPSGPPATCPPRSPPCGRANPPSPACFPASPRGRTATCSPCWGPRSLASPCRLPAGGLFRRLCSTEIRTPRSTRATAIGSSRSRWQRWPRTSIPEWSTAGCPGGHAYSRTLHADASGQAILEQWVIHGAGHAWSGGSPSGSFTDPRGPDATREMLRFFLEHSHPATPMVT